MKALLILGTKFKYSTVREWKDQLTIMNTSEELSHLCTASPPHTWKAFHQVPYYDCADKILTLRTTVVKLRSCNP